ncbi:hypothetical protein L6452_33387 [Arctium lappa]|uniref:Uncharacterized protein n=1 Tax=Arctium lappa TaxID=4217 RepID=A0ACB8YF76_ARCLA|nr:hypothetical protein L6452_33387 [Arctium lappa]
MQFPRLYHPLQPPAFTIHHHMVGNVGVGMRCPVPPISRLNRIGPAIFKLVIEVFSCCLYEMKNLQLSLINEFKKVSCRLFWLPEVCGWATAEPPAATQKADDKIVPPQYERVGLSSHVVTS